MEANKMVEYIRRDLVMQKGADVPGFFSKMISSYDVMEIPVEDVEPVKHGKWIFNTDDFVPKYRCSSCGYNRPIMAGENVKQEPSNFCNNCGAKMELED